MLTFKVYHDRQDPVPNNLPLLPGFEANPHSRRPRRFSSQKGMGKWGSISDSETRSYFDATRNTFEFSKQTAYGQC